MSSADSSAPRRHHHRAPWPAWLTPALRLSFRLAPRATSRLFARSWHKLPRAAPSPPGARFSERERRLESCEHGSFGVWSMGSGPSVYLVHGWGGRAEQLAGFVDPVLAAGYAVVAFDAPGHGSSRRGKPSMVATASALQAVVDRHGLAHAIIGHSLGARVTFLALNRGLETDRVVLLAPAGDPRRELRHLLRSLGARRATSDAVEREMARQLRFGGDEIDVPVLAPMPSLLVIHDRADREVGPEHGEAIVRSWPGAQLVTTAGLGHRRMLRDPDIIARAVEFVAGRSPTAGAESGSTAG